MKTSEHSADFWNDETNLLKETDASSRSFASFGTVTKASATVNLRDQLEKAHFDRVVDLHQSHEVLDLGGGAGRFALWVAPRVAHVTVVDASSKLLDVGQRESEHRGITNVSFVHSSALSFQTDRKFDVILIMGMATHLCDDDVRFLMARCAALLRPGGRLVMKEPVSADSELRKDERFNPDGSLRYRAWFRPSAFYRVEAERHFCFAYQAPTCAHPIPWFLGETNQAAEQTSGPLASAVLSMVTPVWVSADPWLSVVERSLREHSATRSLLADVRVLQELFVFTKPREEADRREGQPELSVVVIAYNEEECLSSMVDELLSTLRSRSLPFEVVLVDDGSSDATREIMTALESAIAEVKVRALKPNRGIGGALKAGFDEAEGRYVTWLPADGQIPSAVVWELYERRLLGAVITTVYRERDDHWIRNAISLYLNTLIWIRTGRRAKSGGNYLMSCEAWRRYGPRDDDSMMLSTAFRGNVRDAGEIIFEHEIDCRRRAAGHSKVLNPRAIGRTLRGLGRLGRQ